VLSAVVFSGLFALFAALTLWHFPRFGLFLYLAAFYVHPPSRWWGEWLPDLRWSLLASVLTMLSFFIHRAKIAPNPRHWLISAPAIILSLFLVLLWVQNLWALDAEMHLDACIQFSKYLIAYYLFYRLAEDEIKATDLIIVNVAGCAYIAWLCFTLGRTGDGRLDGVGGPGIDDANTMSMVLAIGFLLSASIALSSTGWRRLLTLLPLPIILNAIFLAGSRGAFLGLLFGLIVVFFLRPKGSTRMLLALAVLGIAAGVALVDDTFIERILTVKAVADKPGEIDDSAGSRLALFDAQVRMFGDHPMGVGHRGTVVLSPLYLDTRWMDQRADGQWIRASHNTVMTLLVEQGIVGIMLFAYLSLWSLATLIRLRLLINRGIPTEMVRPAAACTAALAGAFLAGQFSDYLKVEVLIWLFAILAASMGRLPSPDAVTQKLATNRTETLAA
jgi:O-antigen ligase